MTPDAVCIEPTLFVGDWAGSAIRRDDNEEHRCGRGLQLFR